MTVMTLNESHICDTDLAGHVVDGDAAPRVPATDDNPGVARAHGAHPRLLDGAVLELLLPALRGPHAEEPGPVSVAVQREAGPGSGEAVLRPGHHVDRGHCPDNYHCHQ